MSRAVVEAVEHLVEVSLTPREKHALVRKLNCDLWGRRLDGLLRRVDERQKGLPPVSMEEIVQEVKAMRRTRASAARRA